MFKCGDRQNLEEHLIRRKQIKLLSYKQRVSDINSARVSMNIRLSTFHLRNLYHFKQPSVHVKSHQIKVTLKLFNTTELE